MAANNKPSEESKNFLAKYGIKLVVMLFILIFVIPFLVAKLRFPDGEFERTLYTRKEIPTVSAKVMGVMRGWTEPTVLLEGQRFKLDVISTDSLLASTVPYEVRVNKLQTHLIDPSKGTNLKIDERVKCLEFRIAPSAPESVTTLHLRVEIW